MMTQQNKYSQLTSSDGIISSALVHSIKLLRHLLCRNKRFTSNFSALGNVILRSSFNALTLLVGRQEGHPAWKKLGDALLMVTIWLELCTSYRSSEVVTTTSFIISSNKIQNGDILVPANPGWPGKWSLDERCSAMSCEPRCDESCQCTPDSRYLYNIRSVLWNEYCYDLHSCVCTDARVDWSWKQSASVLQLQLMVACNRENPGRDSKHSSPSQAFQTQPFTTCT